MKNNNQAIVRKMTARALRSDKRRNFFVVAAIALTTLMIASVFSIGMSVLDSIHMQQVRLMGTTAHAAVTRPTDADREKLRRLDYVKAIGTGNHVGTVNSTPRMGDLVLTLYRFDEIQWKEMRVPAYTDVVGAYPQKENEIMFPLMVLERMGITPEIGMEIPISYVADTGGNGVGQPYDEAFILSGWYTSYVHIRSGNLESLLVSEALSDRHGRSVEADGAVNLIFKDDARVNEYCARVERALGIDGNRVRPVPMYETNNPTVTFIALLLIAAFLIFTGYLLIYNVMYISVARNVRFYGLLKTVGTTPRQIRKIVRGQIVALCAIGIPLGAALSLIISVVFVPSLIMAFSAPLTGAVVSFSPFIYAGAAAFALLTAFLGAIKPAKKAAGVSPIEAKKYTGMEQSRYKIHFHANGKPYRMALRNIFRDRKRAAVVFLSLFLGMTVFIAVTTMVASMDTDNYVDSYLDSDFELTNNTTDKQKFDDGFMEKIRGLSGFESLMYDTTAWFYTTYTPEFDDYLYDYVERNPHFLGESENFAENLQSVKDNFTGVAIGIESAELAKLNKDYDIAAFERGEYVLLAVEDHPLTDAPLFDGVKNIELRSMDDNRVLADIAVGGYTPFLFHTNGGSIAPTLIMSNALMEKLAGGAIRSKLYIDVAQGGDAPFLDALKTMTDGDYEISRNSRIESRAQLQDAKMMLYILGGGIAFILGLIGVLNFVNVMSVGIEVRKQEIAALESVGMSRRQMRAMLLCEGAGYAIITLLLVAFLGNAATYGLFKMFQQEATYAVFTYPFIPVAVTALVILAVCALTPEMVYRAVNKLSLVERLREAE